MRINPELHSGVSTVYEVTCTPEEIVQLDEHCYSPQGVAEDAAQSTKRYCAKSGILGNYMCGLQAQADAGESLAYDASVISCKNDNCSDGALVKVAAFRTAELLQTRINETLVPIRN